MESEEYWAKMYCQRENRINGRMAWLYLLQTSIGNIIAVEYEKPDKEIFRKLFDEHYEQAEKYFETICMKMLTGKI